MKRLAVQFLAMGAAALLIGACGGDTKKTNTDGGKKSDSGTVKLDKGTNPPLTDGSVVLKDIGPIGGDGTTTPGDGGSTGVCDPAVVGTACSSKNNCKTGWCLLLDQTKDIGICTCDCTPDDSATPLVN